MKKQTIFQKLIFIGFLILVTVFHCIGQPKDLLIKRDDKQSDEFVGVALLIGNSDYEYAAELNSPVNDAKDMAKVLGNLGFKILPVRANASLNEMEKAVTEFERELSANKGVGVFYFSGHGVQSKGLNYIIPVDANIPTEAFLRQKAIDLESVMETMEGATGKAKIVILDACRNDPFKGWKTKGDNEKGLAKVDAPDGMLVAFATSPKRTAADGFGRNSPYTEILLQEIAKPNISITDMLQNVRTNLSSKYNQISWENTSLLGRFCFAGCNNVIPDPKSSETTFWHAIENSNEIEDFENYLKRLESGEFKGIYKSTAELKIIRLNKAKLITVWSKIKPTAKLLLQYNYAYSRSEGYTTVVNNSLTENGIIDETGKLVIPLKYGIADLFSDGLALIRYGSKWGFIDKTGKEIIPLKYDNASAFSEGLAVVSLGDYSTGKRGFIDKTGKEIIPLKFDFALSFSEGLASVRIGDYLTGKDGFIDKTGREIIPFKYDRAGSFSDGLAPVAIGARYGYIDKTGKEVIPLKYEHQPILQSFSDGLAIVKLNGKYGFIDKTGKEITPLKYDDAYSFSDGLAYVSDGENSGFIDKTGKIIIINRNISEYFFSGGLLEVRIGDYSTGKHGFIDKTGKEVAPVKYDKIWCYAFRKEGFIGVTLNGKKGFVDIYGNEYFDF